MTYNFLDFWQVDDIRTCHIDDVLEEMGDMMLCDLPEDTAWTVNEFITNSKVQFIHAVCAC